MTIPRPAQEFFSIGEVCALTDLKPLYSFSRYALSFFPMFWVWGNAGKNPWLNRLILYPSLLLLLYFSGQFFIWGWIA